MKQNYSAQIILENVSFSHQPNQKLLKNISFQIEAGEWISIVGKNGSGKSTLAKLINGLCEKREGMIQIEGIPQDQDTIAEIRERIGFIFPNPDHQFLGMTVEDDIAFGLENRCMCREQMKKRVTEYAELLKISDLLNRHPHTLSGGQKQRVAIAAVLAMEPSIIIFDEATSMLDEQSKQEILKMMKQMKKSGRYTLLSVTHDTDEMFASDRILALANGEIIADGTPLDIFKNQLVKQECSLHTPYILELCIKLQQQGIDIDSLLTVEELRDALWRLSSNKSPMPMVEV